MSKHRGPSLYDFLIEADLVEYYSGFKEKLNINNVSYLNFVVDEDLHGIGMSNPDIRRLKDHFEKYFPQTVLGKVKKMILPKNKRDKWEPTNPNVDPDAHLVEVSGRVTSNKHIIPSSAITIHKELGSGEFGVVHQGTWSTDEGRMQVAVKSLTNHRMQTNPIDFLKEAAIMHQIDHENIVPLHGVVLDPPSFLLVTELAPLRSLLECLKETSPSFRINFSVPTLCDFAVQICNGMKYLEEKRLIHRDLAARNILVFQKDKVKISDFGLSRALRVGKDYYQTNYSLNLKLPVAWCAPEIVNYLRFTSASDVWAYGVTLWEMFSYGFQPWAALSGSQILSAIDFPNFQRLEQPECCPMDYYKIMLKCWEHDPCKRLTFLDLSKSLPDCKPEQVQAINNSGEDRVKRDQLTFKIGDIITVLDKKPPEAPENYWKGVLNNGRCGFFNPTHTITYLGFNLPSNKMGKFARGENKLYTSRRRSKLKPEMISSPEKDFKHTAHIGVDGAYFGDVKGILPPSTKYNNLPHQIVTPYKPQDDSNSYEPSISNPVYQSDKAPLLSSDGRKTQSDGVWIDYESIKTSNTASCSKLLDHEYHEIANGENYLESPRFEKAFDFGPSLLDEMEAVMKTLGTETNNSMVNGISNYGASPPPSPMDKDINKFKELRDITFNTHSKGKKKSSTVKSISAADQKTIDSAIAMANELATRSISDAEDGKFGRPDSPDTPCSPNKKKFSFKFPITSSTLGHSSKSEKKTISKETVTAPDLQNCLTEEAKVAYNTLIEQNTSTSFSEDSSVASPHKLFQMKPPKITSRSRSNFTDFKRNIELQNQVSIKENITNDKNDGANVIPLPPRDRTKTMCDKPRHQRKHPLIIPGSEHKLLGRLNSEDFEEIGGNSFSTTEVNNTDTSSVGLPANNQEDNDNFDQRISSELEALDNLMNDQPRNVSPNAIDDDPGVLSNVKTPAEWDNIDLQAVKLCRLESFISNETGAKNMTDSATNIAALQTMNWDVGKAASLIMENIQLS